ncbi:hypothetical protein, partial [Acinetobacter baumannii]|uniref:hypothetical protein n=1 Tax=Acinetobacter baumannii TaxID=470 RepID=UPI001C09A30C
IMQSSVLIECRGHRPDCPWEHCQARGAAVLRRSKRRSNLPRVAGAREDGAIRFDAAFGIVPRQ